MVFRVRVRADIFPYFILASISCFAIASAVNNSSNYHDRYKYHIQHASPMSTMHVLPTDSSAVQCDITWHYTINYFPNFI